jgi:prevent-host-death family protein
MKKINISEVRNHLPSLLEQLALSNEPIVVTRHGKPVAKILPFRKAQSKPERYPLRNLPVRISKDFDKPATEPWEALGE